MENQLDPRTALQVLAKAAELYVATLDELARTFTVPNLQAAIASLDATLPKEAANEPVA